MSMAAGQFDALAEALSDYHSRFGTGGWADRRRLLALLADKVPEAKREIRAIGTAVDEGIVAALSSSERHLLGMEIDRLADRLDAATGLRFDIARPVVRAFAYGLGLGPLPSVYVSTSVPTPSAEAHHWAGLSVPASGSASYGTAPLLAPRPAPGVLFAGRRLSRTMLIGAGVAATALLVATQAVRLPGDQAPGTTGTASATNAFFADEVTDFGVPAQSGLQANVGSPTPLAIPVGQRIATGDLQGLLARERATVLIDVLGDPHPSTIANAVSLPLAGQGGTLNDATQRQVAAALAKIASGGANPPMVFFCAGAKCWESYNAVLRANAAGYANLYWYRGGLASWAAAGLPMAPMPAPATSPS